MNPSDAKAAIVKSPPAQSIQDLIQSASAELGRALPEHLKPERMVRIALTCIRLNPELGECTPASFLGALFTCAQLGLEPVAGKAYLIPFNNKRKVGNEWKTVKEVQFVEGYKGIVELFYRHNKAVSLGWRVVKENDDFNYELGTKPFLRHVPSRKERGETIGYWVSAELSSGGRPFHFMTKAECMDHGKKHSKTFDKTAGDFKPSSPWAKEPDAMCLKTVLIQLSKLLPLSIEFQRALEADETSRDFNKHIENSLDMQVTTSWEAEEPPVSPPEKKENPEAQKPTEPEPSGPVEPPVEAGRPDFDPSTEVIAFGKAKGKTWNEVDTPWLKWLYNNTPQEDLKKKAAMVLATRGESITTAQVAQKDPVRAESKKRSAMIAEKIRTAKVLASLEKVTAEINDLVDTGVLVTEDYKALQEAYNKKVTELTPKD